MNFMVDADLPRSTAEALVTDPLQFPETSHHGLIIVRIRETLPPSFVNDAIVLTLSALRDDELPNAIVIVEETRFRRRSL